MRLAAVVSEARRNVASASARTLLLTAMTAAAFAVLATADTVATGQLAKQAAVYRDSGAPTLILNADDMIDGAACDRLSSVDGIAAAGAIRTAAEPLQPVATPGQSIPLEETSPGFAAVIASRAKGGITVASDVAAQYTTRLPAHLATAVGDVIIGDTYPFPDDGRNPTLGYAALAPVAADSGPFDSCWATIWPADPGKQVLLYSAITTSPPPDADITITQLNPTHGTSFAGADLLAGHTTRYAPAAAAIIGVILTLGSARLRRLELAAARHLGVTRTALTCQILIETACWAPIAGLAAGAATVAAGIALHAGTAAIALGAKAIVAGFAGCFAGALIAGTITSPRQIVNYFKQR